MFRCRSSDGENFDIVPNELDFSLDGRWGFLSGYFIKLRFLASLHIYTENGPAQKREREDTIYCMCASWDDLGDTIREQAKRLAFMIRRGGETAIVELVGVEFVDDGIYLSEEYATFMRATQ